MDALAEMLRNFSSDVVGYEFMWILILPAIFAVAIAVERIIFILIKSDINAPKFMTEIRKLTAAGKYEDALELCNRAQDRALPKVVACGLRTVVGRDSVDFRTVQNSVDEGMLEVVPKLTQRTHYLAMIANVATLLGLLGTIAGLVLSFKAISSPGIDATEKARLLASGISTAMNTTLFGLIIAVPTILTYTYLMTRTNKIIDEIDEHMVKFINLLTGNR